MYNQQGNTAAVVINWSCSSLWAKLLWQPASQAGKRAAPAYKSALDPSLEGGKKRCKECMKWWVSEVSVWDCCKELNRKAAPVLWLNYVKTSGALIFPFSPYEQTSHDAHPVGSATYWQIIQSSPSSACRLCLFWVNEIYSTNAQNK